MRNLLTLILLLASFSAIAGPASGPSSGGGGGALVCFADDNKTIKSAYLLDLEEANFYDDNPVDDEFENRPWRDIFGEVINRLQRFDPDFSYQLRFNAMMILRVVGNYDPVPGSAFQDVIWPQPEDLSHGRLPPITPDKFNCRVYTAAVFQDYVSSRESGAFFNLLISKPIWDKMSEIHKAALLVHETVYRTYRMAAKDSILPIEMDSSATRRLVGRAFSNVSNLAVSSGFADKFKSKAAFQRGISADPGNYYAPFMISTMRAYASPLYVGDQCRKLIIRLDKVAAAKGQCRLQVASEGFLRRDHPNYHQISRELKSTKQTKSDLEFNYDVPTELEAVESLVLNCKDNNVPDLTLFCAQSPQEKVGNVVHLPNKNFGGITIFKKEKFNLFLRTVIMPSLENPTGSVW